ncbi:MAG: hypothetical protein JNK94_01000 [Hyphomonadaceae bacterium]|nr:hypothetical protein [Hyphomonadaceae bacterium]MBX3510841.1 hypothetical protein [Hyphomonadaceae bacterium]
MPDFAAFVFFLALAAAAGDAFVRVDRAYWRIGAGFVLAACGAALLCFAAMAFGGAREAMLALLRNMVLVLATIAIAAFAAASVRHALNALGARLL